MCGINGFNFLDSNKIEEMNEAISHRGPDGNGSYDLNKISLGHVRLSIIDLSETGAQPMSYSHKGKKIRITYNGEIYNYLEIKKQLQQKGYEFNSTSDTEVILASYCEYGEECVNYLNGMWAFCIHDEEKNTLFCSRDRLGVKPFYYYYHEGKFIFSSELKAILCHQDLKINDIDEIDKDALKLYFSLGYIPSPISIYKKVKKLEARQNLVFDLESRTINKLWSYFEINEYNPSQDITSLKKECNDIFENATKIRMRSDVPVGAFLSGGVDSTSVVGKMKDNCDIQQLHTFSIGFEKAGYDETAFIDIAAKAFKSQHHHEYFVKESFDSIKNNYSYIYDEPFGDYSGFPTKVVSRMAREHVTVCLSGDGGDEVFGGYDVYTNGLIVQRLKYIPAFLRTALYNFLKLLPNFSIKRSLSEALKLSLVKGEDFYSYYVDSERYYPKVYKEWTTKKMKYCLDKCKGNLPEALRVFDLLYNKLPDNFLVKVDRASMHHSLEVRSPFLDFRFINFSQKIPTKWKINFKDSKILLKNIVQGIIPNSIINRSKKGFTPPLIDWINDDSTKKDLKKYTQYLKDLDTDLFNFYKEIVFTKSYAFNSYYKIRLLIFGLWYEYWIENKPSKENSNTNVSHQVH